MIIWLKIKNKTQHRFIFLKHAGQLSGPTILQIPVAYIENPTDRGIRSGSPRGNGLFKDATEVFSFVVHIAYERHKFWFCVDRQHSFEQHDKLVCPGRQLQNGGVGGVGGKFSGYWWGFSFGVGRQGEGLCKVVEGRRVLTREGSEMVVMCAVRSLNPPPHRWPRTSWRWS